MLLLRDCRYASIGRVAFFGHTPNKATRT
jgi:hypothetical protein